ncbi:MAG: hypothetical protein NTZ56_24490 [Acidobacteria bacterium]|nr:hypothetical protein [Acidobacteriota bacterium]
MIVVVGGNTRNIGKTTLVCDIIRALPQLNWTAVKITQYGHSACANEGGDCHCAPADPACPYALDEQLAADSTDTGRYLDAGARHSFWLRTRAGLLAEGLSALRQLLQQAENVVLESNSIMQYLKPDLYLTVVDRTSGDFKLSAQKAITLADLQVGPQQLPLAVARVQALVTLRGS